MYLAQNSHVHDDGMENPTHVIICYVMETCTNLYLGNITAWSSSDKNKTNSNMRR